MSDTNEQNTESQESTESRSSVVRCPHCGSDEFGKPFEDSMYENGIDDPQYGGKIIIVPMKDCLNCGETIEL